MEFNVAVLRGDGVGATGMTQALNVLQGVRERFGHSFNLNEDLVDAVAIDTPVKALSCEILHIIVECAKARLERRIMSNMLRANVRGA
jgi:isocitrate/isopropylmalate dehydrogenase